MKQEDNDLLLRDLCARLSYGVIVECGCKYDGEDIGEKKYKLTGRIIDSFFDGVTIRSTKVYSLKPYLRPMSSMTEEEQLFIEDKFAAKIDSGNGCYIETYTSSESGVSEVCLEDMCELIRYLNSRHFDYQRKYDEKDGKWKSMIEVGLALPAPEGMYNEIKEERK